MEFLRDGPFLPQPSTGLAPGRQSDGRNGKAASCLSRKVARVIRLPRVSAALALDPPPTPGLEHCSICQGFPRVSFHAVRPRVVPHNLGGTSGSMKAAG